MVQRRPLPRIVTKPAKDAAPKKELVEDLVRRVRGE
jgi:hypothetical protein